MKVKLTNIDIPNKLLDNEQEKIIEELAVSIADIGLSHPVILKKCSPGEQFPIISGERRILAVKKLGWKEIDADVRDVTAKHGSIIRIQENLRRYNLPWPMQVDLVAELHKLRQDEHGTAANGRPSKEADKGWSLRDTAKELNVSLGSLSEDMLLSRAIDRDPNLLKIKDKKTAIKLARIGVLREQSDMESGAPQTSIRKSIGLEVDQVYCGDSADILKQLPDESIDHCITDPPWLKYYDASLRIDDRTLPVFKELYRVLKNDAFLYIFGGIHDYVYYSGRWDLEGNEYKKVVGKLEPLGFKVATTPLLWHKTKSLSRRGVRSWEYDRDFEFIIVAVKGNPTFTQIGKLEGIKNYDIVPSPSVIHPNEKPLALIKDIIEDCSYENQIIVDPFAGSGVLGVACKKMNRSYIMIERDELAHDTIVKRLARVK